MRCGTVLRGNEKQPTTATAICFQSRLSLQENEGTSDLGSIGVTWWAAGYERETSVLLGCCSAVTDCRLGWNSFDLDLSEHRVIAARRLVKVVF